MMKHILFILVFIFSCNQKSKDILTLSISSSDIIYTKNSKLSLSCELNNINIDNANIKYYFNDKEINENILLSNSKLGTNTIKAQLKVDDLTLTTKKTECPRGEMVDTKDLKGFGFTILTVSDSL